MHLYTPFDATVQKFKLTPEQVESVREALVRQFNEAVTDDLYLYTRPSGCVFTFHLVDGIIGFHQELLVTALFDMSGWNVADVWSVRSATISFTVQRR
jgi:hypothetical protein